MPTLHSTLQNLASAFATSVLEAVRSGSLSELLGETGGAVRRGPGRPRAVETTHARPAARVGRPGRLKRRSPEDIAKALDEVVALLKKNKTGLRAEQIREELGMQAKEMPRVLKEGLGKRAFKSKGQKRATTYFAT
jgi:hypothetical protein